MLGNLSRSVQEKNKLNLKNPNAEAERYMNFRQGVHHLLVVWNAAVAALGCFLRADPAHDFSMDPARAVPQA